MPKASIFYNNVPDKLDGPGWYVWINGVGCSCGPFTEEEARQELDEYLMSTVDPGDKRPA